MAVAGERRPAVEWARRAAVDAARALAYEEASRLYASALAHGGAALAAGERAELLLAQAGVEVAAGRFADAFAACRRAVELADGAGRTDLVATAALTLDAVGDGTWDRTVQSWCLRALDAPGDDEARLLARLAETRFYSGDVAGADAPAARRWRWPSRALIPTRSSRRSAPASSPTAGPSTATSAPSSLAA